MALFDSTLFFPNDYIPLFEKIIDAFGLYLQYTESDNWWEKFFGFKITEQNDQYLVSQILMDSPAYSQLSLYDEIIAINNFPAKDIFNDKNFHTHKILCTINRFHKIKTIEISANKNQTYYQKLSLHIKEKRTKKEIDLFNHLIKM
ncbi:MAG: hypothetical protein D6799_00220 [Bacteroidetes bacterium]|nr:MAG: hypothetical protein D6799_00220 [Bacteroidota bacterium]